MNRISSTQELSLELKKILDYSRSYQPSRVVLANSLRKLADRLATEFPSEEALNKYLKDHPEADKSKHTVKKEPEKIQKDSGGSDDPYKIRGDSWTRKDQDDYARNLKKHAHGATMHAIKNIKKIFEGKLNKPMKGYEIGEALVASGVIKDRYQARWVEQNMSTLLRDLVKEGRINDVGNNNYTLSYSML